LTALPNILGKSLCGNDFFLDLERYGYSIKTTQTFSANATETSGRNGEKKGDAKPGNLN
jgi:hypothetical protein